MNTKATDIGELYSFATKYKPTVTVGVPSVYEAWLQEAGSGKLPFRVADIGGAPVPLRLIKQLIDKGCIVITGLSGTEMGDVSRVCYRPGDAIEDGKK